MEISNDPPSPGLPQYPLSPKKNQELGKETYQRYCAASEVETYYFQKEFAEKMNEKMAMLSARRSDLASMVGFLLKSDTKRQQDIFRRKKLANPHWPAAAMDALLNPSATLPSLSDDIDSVPTSGRSSALLAPAHPPSLSGTSAAEAMSDIGDDQPHSFAEKLQEVAYPYFLLRAEAIAANHAVASKSPETLECAREVEGRTALASAMLLWPDIPWILLETSHSMEYAPEHQVNHVRCRMKDHCQEVTGGCLLVRGSPPPSTAAAAANKTDKPKDMLAMPLCEAHANFLIAWHAYLTLHKIMRINTSSNKTSAKALEQFKQTRLGLLGAMQEELEKHITDTTVLKLETHSELEDLLGPDDRLANPRLCASWFQLRDAIKHHIPQYRKRQTAAAGGGGGASAKKRQRAAPAPAAPPPEVATATGDDTAFVTDLPAPPKKKQKTSATR